MPHTGKPIQPKTTVQQLKPCMCGSPRSLASRGRRLGRLSRRSSAENKKQYSKLRWELAQRQAVDGEVAKTAKAENSSAPELGPVCCPECFKEFVDANIPRNENSAGHFCKGSWKRGVPAPKPEHDPEKPTTTTAPKVRVCAP